MNFGRRRRIGAPFTHVDTALARSHARLAALSTDPALNARHVAKALVKFYLLEIRSATLEQLVQHLAGARYFHLKDDRYFGVTLAAFLAKIVRESAAVGATDWHDGGVANRDTRLRWM